MAAPAVAGIGSVLGGGGGPGGAGSNRGTMFISLKPAAGRAGITTEQVIEAWATLRLRGQQERGLT